jgi:hypothetical protein
MASFLSYRRISEINGYKRHIAHTTKERLEEMVSAIVAVENVQTFKNAPKDISRYPSVKNLKKLLKK